uniref:Mth938 domain-containing protein n=1 Tax=Eptatretus burgeri TaxID=7764 RepID=A0A8C4QWI8_EPTBU
MTSPQILKVEWGSVNVIGAGGTFKDCKVWPGGSRAWDWRETGTKHEPGVQPADIQEVLDHGATTIIVGRGMNERLQVPKEIETYVTSHGANLKVFQTEAAVLEYNRLALAGGRVGGLFHTTC